MNLLNLKHTNTIVFYKKNVHFKKGFLYGMITVQRSWFAEDIIVNKLHNIKLFRYTFQNRVFYLHLKYHNSDKGKIYLL